MKAGWKRAARTSVVLAVVSGLAVVVVTSSTGSTSALRSTTKASTTTCHLGNGVQHVVNIVFDNVHFSRDNPNVQSDIEQIPTLMHFLEQNGTLFSNVHTPMIAHTADDSLTIYTGLYGDRHGQPLTNSYKTYNPDGTTDPAASFAYWTSPAFDTQKPNPSSGHDTTPTMVYSDTVPASGTPDRITPAPWVPFTRAGCTVGDFSTANMVLENPTSDLPTVFGPNSPEVAQLKADPDSFKDPENADYVGVAVHCAQNDTICSSAQAPRGIPTTPPQPATPTAVDDNLPTEPGGYSQFQALFGARYIAPQLGAGTPDLKHNGYVVTNHAGNLVDLDGNQINGAFLSTPGFPGFSPTASQTLAYMADMQEAGIPVTYGYISDLHEFKAGSSGCTTATATKSTNPLGPGDTCYAQNAAKYDHAFQVFFARLAADGITPANTEFVISAEEGDQFAGANAARKGTQPTPNGCDGLTTLTACNYASGQIGELQANIKGLLSSTTSSGTQFDIEPQGASLYVHGQPAANDPTVRQLERDTAAMTTGSFTDPYDNVTGEKITAYQAGALEERVLHMQTADPLRLPTYTLFPKPDYFFSTSGANVSINSAFAYDHGYYSPNIDITWAGMVGPGVAKNGLDGPTPEQGNQPHDPESTNTVPEASQNGTWVEEADLRPTLMYLAGLTDDYQTDGHVVTQALASVPKALQATEDLATGYDQINSSVGQFATDTLIADSHALASGSGANDGEYATEQQTLSTLADDRDSAATKIKQTLAQAAAGQTPSHGDIQSGLSHVKELLGRADRLAASTP
jgi:hypothetical protein